eukprot:g2842.t1
MHDADDNGTGTCIAGSNPSLSELHSQIQADLSREIGSMSTELNSLSTEHERLEHESLEERSGRITSVKSTTYLEALRINHPLLRLLQPVSGEQYEFYPKRHLVLILFCALCGQLAAAATFNDTGWEHIDGGDGGLSAAEASPLCGEPGGADDCKWAVTKALLIAAFTTIQVSLLDGFFAADAAAKQLEHRCEIVASEEWLGRKGAQRVRGLRLQAETTRAALSLPLAHELGKRGNTKESADEDGESVSVASPSCVSAQPAKLAGIKSSSAPGTANPIHGGQQEAAEEAVEPTSEPKPRQQKRAALVRCLLAIWNCWATVDGTEDGENVAGVKDDTDDVTVDASEQALSLVVDTKVALKMASAVQRATARVRHTMLLSHVRDLCLSDHIGSQVMVQLPDMTEPLEGWVEGVYDEEHGDYGAHEDDGRSSLLVVVLSKTKAKNQRAPARALRIAVPQTCLLFVSRGRARYLSPCFAKDGGDNGGHGDGGSACAAQSKSGSGSRSGSKVQVCMSSWRYYWFTVGMSLELHAQSAWLHKLLGCLWPWWHQRLVAEGESHAGVMITVHDTERLARHVELVKELHEEAVELEKQEQERAVEQAWAAQQQDDEKANKRSCCRCACTSGLRRWALRRCVSKTRAKKQQALLEVALLDTLDPWRRKRLLAEQELKGTLTTLSRLLFNKFFGVEQKPTDVEEESGAMRAAVLLLCYVYLGLLSYYTLMLMLVMKQRDAIACMTVWFASFFSEQMLTQPATLLITGFLLPAFVAHQFVEPIFRRRREKRHQDLRHAAGRAAMLSSASRRHLLVLGTGAGSRPQAGATAAGHASLPMIPAADGL